ncbi:aminotransferase class V-fold PLP-dependent enzyme [Oryzobacter telluris]|uniref:aminotransferase class V-fold PLP-dependent enzyme n=1 Tax=Oryzobacter telluris TaxID=3149179 RepID=UPI00370DC1A5
MTSAAAPVPAPVPLTLPDGRPARDAWALTPATVHVNHGSFGAVPRASLEHQAALRAEMEADPVGWFALLTERVAAARADLAAALGAAPEHTALVPNASAGASVVYANLPAAQGAEVVVTDHGYGAVTMGAERAARRWGGRVRTAHVPLDASADDARDAVLATLSPATRLLVVDQITSATARHLPVAAITAGARDRGVLTLVDGAHAPGLVDRPTEGLGADVWVGNLHKFACAPRSVAALVAPGGLRHDLYPLIDSWGARDEFPERFDVQGTLDLTAWLAAPTSWGFLEETWGWEALRAHLTAMADHAEDVVGQAFSARTGEDHRVDVGMPVNALRLVRLPAGLGATLEEADALRDRVVAEHGFAAAFTSFGGTGYLRLSVHAYTTAEDVAQVAERLVPVLCDLAAGSGG